MHVDISTWQWVKKCTRNGNPGKWKHGLNPWSHGGLISTLARADKGIWSPNSGIRGSYIFFVGEVEARQSA